MSVGGGSRDAGTVIIVDCGTSVVAIVLVGWYSMVMVPSSPRDSAFVVTVCVLVGAGNVTVVGGESDVCPVIVCVLVGAGIVVGCASDVCPVIVCVLVGAGIVVGSESDVCPAFRSDSSWLDVGPACE